MRNHTISIPDLNQFRLWIETRPEVPEGDWYKDFGSTKIWGKGSYRKRSWSEGKLQRVSPLISALPRIPPLSSAKGGEIHTHCSSSDRSPLRYGGSIRRRRVLIVGRFPSTCLQPNFRLTRNRPEQGGSASRRQKSHKIRPAAEPRSTRAGIISRCPRLPVQKRIPSEYFGN